MNQAVKLASTLHSLDKPNHDAPRQNHVDQQDLRLDRARCALRALSALLETQSEDARNESLMGSRGDLADLVEIIRAELEAGLTGKHQLM
jgi:hypothetical protein